MSGEVPEGWIRSKLGDYLRLEYGKALPEKARVMGTFPVFGSSGIVGYHNTSSVPGPCIVIGRKGNAGSVTLSEVECWPIDTTYYVLFVREMDVKWCYYCLHWLSLGELNEATGVPGLNRDRVAGLVVDIPPLPEQRRIAEILSSVDEAIQATQAVIDQTRTVKQGVLERLLTKGIGHTRFKQTEIGEIPESWEIVEVGDVCTRVTYGFTNPMPTTNSGPWMLTAANIRDGYIDYSSARHTSSDAYSQNLTEKSRPAIGTVLITKDGTLGRIAIVDREEVCINQSIAALVPNKNIVLTDYLSACLQSDGLQERILFEAGGTSIRHIYITKLARTLMPLPSMDEQCEIVRWFSFASHASGVNSAKLEHLRSLKQSLMADLLTGRKRVSTALSAAAE